MVGSKGGLTTAQVKYGEPPAPPRKKKLPAIKVKTEYRPFRYFQFTEKETSQISIGWKVVHLLLFILISIASLVSLFAINDIFDMFNYNCILFCDPAYEYLTPMANHTAKFADFTGKTFKETEVVWLPVMAPVLSNNITIPNITQAEKIPKTKDMYIYEDRLWRILPNGHVIGFVYMWMTRSAFSSSLLCNYVIFIPLASMIIGAVLSSITCVCGKGGKGYESDTLPASWALVAPILVVSFIMAMFSMNASSLVFKGLNYFCRKSESLVGSRKCNRYVDYITEQHMMGVRHYYLDYMMCYFSFSMMTILWCFQLGVAILRTVLFTDFDLTSVFVGKKSVRYSAAVEEVWDVGYTKTVKVQQVRTGKDTLELPELDK